MTDAPRSLVERLRRHAANSYVEKDMRDAADRIAALEREVAELNREVVYWKDELTLARAQVREQAAKWHDDQRAYWERMLKGTPANVEFAFQLARAQNRIEMHEDSAAAIRAMKLEQEP